MDESAMMLFLLNEFLRWLKANLHIEDIQLDIKFKDDGFLKIKRLLLHR